MNQKELDFLLEQNDYFMGGTKEACVKIKDFLRNETHTETKIQSSNTCVSALEFIEAVKVLTAFAFKQNDQIPETWHCDSDCKKISDLLCPGECNVDKNAKKLCPYFMDEGLI